LDESIKNGGIPLYLRRWPFVSFYTPANRQFFIPAEVVFGVLASLGLWMELFFKASPSPSPSPSGLTPPSNLLPLLFLQLPKFMTDPVTSIYTSVLSVSLVPIWNFITGIPSYFLGQGRLVQFLIALGLFFTLPIVPVALIAINSVVWLLMAILLMQQVMFLLKSYKKVVGMYGQLKSLLRLLIATLLKRPNANNKPTTTTTTTTSSPVIPSKDKKTD